MPLLYGGCTVAVRSLCGLLYILLCHSIFQTDLFLYHIRLLNLNLPVRWLYGGCTESVWSAVRWFS